MYEKIRTQNEQLMWFSLKGLFDKYVTFQEAIHIINGTKRNFSWTARLTNTILYFRIQIDLKMYLTSWFYHMRISIIRYLENCIECQKLTQIIDLATQSYHSTNLFSIRVWLWNKIWSSSRWHPMAETWTRKRRKDN